MRKGDPQYQADKPMFRRDDKNWQQETDWKTRLIMRLFPRQVNRVADAVIGKAYGRGIIDSWIMHEMAGTLGRIIWPKRS